jgi:thiol-disulfide isomerase/thioredoxin
MKPVLLSGRIYFAALIPLLLGCQPQIPKKGMWLGTMTISSNKQLPFRMFLDLEGPKPSGCFINGYETTQVPEISLNGDSLSLFFSEYNSAMLGVWNGNEWHGQFLRYRSDTLSNEFTSSPYVHAAAVSEKNKTASLPSGKFRVFIYDKNEVDSTSLAVFRIEGDSVFGTIYASDGDYGLFAGTRNGSRVELSRFTGWQAFLMELERQDSGNWKGNLYSRSGEPFSIMLLPCSPLFREPESVHKPALKNPGSPFFFSGISCDGERINSSNDRFRNKAMILDIMGTWCHNCLDATPLLQRLYAEFRGKGLEVIGLSFEITDNPEQAKKNLSLFRKRYGITYTLLFCGSAHNAAGNSKILDQIRDFYGYPTTIFIDKKNSVREIEVGFKGPATGDGYKEQTEKYYRLVSEILK